jgi:hypothetical protein
MLCWKWSVRQWSDFPSSGVTPSKSPPKILKSGFLGETSLPSPPYFRFSENWGGFRWGGLPLPLKFSALFGSIKAYLTTLTEKSKPPGTDREAGAWIETPAQEKTAEVRSRVAHGKFARRVV